jgi:hypothetical protein
MSKKIIGRLFAFCKLSLKLPALKFLATVFVLLFVAALRRLCGEDGDEDEDEDDARGLPQLQLLMMGSFYLRERVCRVFDG